MPKKTNNKTDSANRAPFRLERELLIRCARWPIDPQSIDVVRKLSLSDLKWSYVLRLAEYHRIVPLLHRYLDSAGGDIPAPVRESLRSRYIENCKANLLLFAELVRLCRSLDTEGIVAIPYKGPCLSLALHGSLAMRQSGDLDILVRRDEFDRARQVLTQSGYRPATPEDTGLEAYSRKVGVALQLVRTDGLIFVDLHWCVTPMYFPSSTYPDELFGHIDIIERSGCRLRIPSSDYLLLALVMHGARHHWARLIWLSDLTTLIETRPLDWSVILDVAQRTSTVRILWVALLMANSVLGAPIPDKVMEQARRDGAAIRLSEKLQAWLFREGAEAPTLVETYAYFLNVRERWTDKARFAAHAARRRMQLTTRDREAGFPELLTPLYYLMRPIRLVREYGLTPVLSFVNELFHRPGK